MNMTFEETFTKKDGGMLMLLCREILRPIYSFFSFFFELMMDRNLGLWGLNAFPCLKWDIQETFENH